MSRSLDDLTPEFKAALLETLEASERVGVLMIPYETQRDVWRQAKLWRKGRTTAKIEEMLNFLRVNGADYLANVIESVGPQNGTWKTNAVPGLSWHQWGLAADCYWDANGEHPGGAEWNDLTGYKIFAEVAVAHGLTSGFFWRSRDAVHVQLPPTHKPDMTIAEISQAMYERYGDEPSAAKRKS